MAVGNSVPAELRTPRWPGQKGNLSRRSFLKRSAHLRGKAIDPSTKLKRWLVLDWTVSSVFAPLPLRMRLLVNQAPLLCSDAVVYLNGHGSLYLPGVCFGNL